MGPFPHDAPRATISPANPAGTDGFEFVEFAHPNPEEARALFTRMGFECVARHRTKAVELWQQGDINSAFVQQSGRMMFRFMAGQAPVEEAMEVAGQILQVFRENLVEQNLFGFITG